MKKLLMKDSMTLGMGFVRAWGWSVTITTDGFSVRVLEYQKPKMMDRKKKKSCKELELLFGHTFGKLPKIYYLNLYVRYERNN